MSMEQPNLEPYVNEELPNFHAQEAVLDDRASNIGNFIGRVSLDTIKIFSLAFTSEMVDNHILGNKLPFVASMAIAAGITFYNRK